MTLTTVPYGLCSNLREGMDVFECIVPVWHGCILNSHRAASLHVRLVEGEKGCEASDNSQVPQNGEEMQPTGTFTC
ncbi:hypothetical protein TNCV_1060971 [Trichonephila clavipes]|nr:hypothetical protein TNCV_1060971 [Trichonephila clavipes]